MCDFMSAMSGGLSILGGKADSIALKSASDFNAAMVEVGVMLSTAEARSTEGDLRRRYTKVRSANLASAAVSGLAPESFKAIREGNVKDLERGAKKIVRSDDMNRQLGEAEAAAIRIQGSYEAKAARYGGMLDAVETLAAAEQGYQENAGADQGRLDYFAKSMGF